jgi:hypothetical protein
MHGAGLCCTLSHSADSTEGIYPRGIEVFDSISIPVGVQLDSILFPFGYIFQEFKILFQN